MERMKIKYITDGKDYVTLPLYEMLEDMYKQLEEENKKLNKKIEKLQIEIGGLMGERDGKQMRIDELEQCNLNLQEWLDNKEKVNKSLREENKKLKSDLSECECSFGFESDEVGFWKREYKRLKKWIKDHCKGYGNLFPEDEMKRQRKKADKKRKKTKEDDELIYEEGLYD